MKPTIILTLLTVSTAIANAAVTKEIALEDVPPEIMDEAEATAPGLEFYRVTVEEENGKLVYEFEAKGPNGKHMEIDISEDGSLEEIEMETAEAELPTTVRTALDRRYPGFVIDYVETSVRGDGRFIYEIEGRNARGERLALDIEETGEILNEEDSAVS
ncbi:MAG: PepSY domain-containing protein [Amphiplicatus sp.]